MGGDRDRLIPTNLISEGRWRCILGPPPAPPCGRGWLPNLVCSGIVPLRRAPSSRPPCGPWKGPLIIIITIIIIMMSIIIIISIIITQAGERRGGRARKRAGSRASGRQTSGLMGGDRDRLIAFKID